MSPHKDDKTTREKTADTEANADDLDEIAQRSLVKYGEETCTICGSRFDAYGYCACGAGGN